MSRQKTKAVVAEDYRIRKGEQDCQKCPLVKKSMTECKDMFAEIFGHSCSVVNVELKN